MLKKKSADQIEKQLEEKISDLDSQLKRAVADYRNLEKRVSEGRSELTNFVGAQLIKKLLPILDNLEIVVEKGQQVLSSPPIFDRETQTESAAGESKDWFRGVELAVKQLKEVLKSEGLDEIAADGQFDPVLHEAVDVKEMSPSLDSSGEPKDNMILEVVRKGYTLNGKVIRPAWVVVSRKSKSSNVNQELIKEGENQNV